MQSYSTQEQDLGADVWWGERAAMRLRCTREGGKNSGLQHLGQLQLPNKRQSRGSLHAAPGQRRRVSKVGLPERPGSLLGLILPHLSDAATLPLLAPSAKPGAACVIRPFIPPD